MLRQGRAAMLRQGRACTCTAWSLAQPGLFRGHNEPGPAGCMSASGPGAVLLVSLRPLKRAC